MGRNDDEDDYENDEKEKIATFEKEGKRNEDDSKGSSLIEEGTEVDAKDLPDVFGAKVVQDSNDNTNLGESRNDVHLEEKSNPIISLFINQKDLKPQSDYSKSLEMNMQAQKKHITSLGSLKGHRMSSHDTARVLEPDEGSQFAPSPDQVGNTLVAIDEMTPSQPLVNEDDSDVKVQDEESNVQVEDKEAKEKPEVKIEEKPLASIAEKSNYVSDNENNQVKTSTSIAEKSFYVSGDERNQAKLSAAIAEKSSYASNDENNQVNPKNNLQQIPETSYKKAASVTNNITMPVPPPVYINQQIPVIEHHRRKDTTLSASTINGNLVPYEENNQIIVSIPPATDTFMSKSFSENKEEFDRNQKLTVSPAKEIATYFASRENEMKERRSDNEVDHGNFINTFRDVGDTLSTHKMEKPGATFRHESRLSDSERDRNNEFGNIDDIVDNFGYPGERSPYVIDFDEDKMEHFVEDLEHKPEHRPKHKTKSTKKKQKEVKSTTKKAEKASHHVNKVVATSPINKHKGYYDMITYADYKKIINTKNLTAIEGLMISKTGHDKDGTSSAVKKKEINKGVKKHGKEININKGFAKLVKGLHSSDHKQPQLTKKASTKKEVSAKVINSIQAETINVKLKAPPPVLSKVSIKNNTVTHHIKIHVNTARKVDQIKSSSLKVNIRDYGNKGAKPIVHLNVIDLKNTKSAFKEKKHEKEKHVVADSGHSGFKEEKVAIKKVLSKEAKTSTVKSVHEGAASKTTSESEKKPVTNIELKKSKTKDLAKSSPSKVEKLKIEQNKETIFSEIAPAKTIKKKEASNSKVSPSSIANNTGTIPAINSSQVSEISQLIKRLSILQNKTYTANMSSNGLPTKNMTTIEDTEASLSKSTTGKGLAQSTGFASTSPENSGKAESASGSGEIPLNHITSYYNLITGIKTRKDNPKKDMLLSNSKQTLMKNLENARNSQKNPEEKDSKVSPFQTSEKVKITESSPRKSKVTETNSTQVSAKLNNATTNYLEKTDKPSKTAEPSKTKVAENEAIIVVAEPEDDKTDDPDTSEFRALEKNTKKLINEVMSEKFGETENQGAIKSNINNTRPEKVDNNSHKLPAPGNKLPKIVPKGYSRVNKPTAKSNCDLRKQTAEKCNLLAAVKEYILDKKLASKSHPLFSPKKKTTDPKKAMESKILLLGKSFLSLVSQFSKYDKNIAPMKKKPAPSKKTVSTAKKSYNNETIATAIKKDPVTGSKRGDSPTPILFGGRPQQLPIYFPPASLFQSYMKPLIQEEAKKQAAGRSPQLGDTSASIINSLEAFKFAANPFSSMLGGTQQDANKLKLPPLKMSILPLVSNKHNLSIIPTGQKKLFLRPLTQVPDKTDLQSRLSTTSTKPLLRSAPPKVASKDIKSKSSAILKLASTLKSKEFNQKLMAAKNEKARQALLAKKQVWQNNVIAALKGGHLAALLPTTPLKTQLRPAKNITTPVNVTKSNVVTLNTTHMIPPNKISHMNTTEKNATTGKIWKNQIYLSAGILAKLNQYPPEKLLEMINTNSLPTFLDGNETANYTTNQLFNPVQKIVKGEKDKEKFKSLKESNIESLGLKSWKFIPLAGSESVIPATKGFMFSPVIQSLVKNNSGPAPKDQYVIKSISDYVHLNAANILQKKIKDSNTLDTIGKPKIEIRNFDKETQYRQGRNRGVQLWKQFINLAEALRDTAGRNIKNIDSKSSLNPHIFFPVKRINNLMRPSSEKNYELSRKVSINNKDNGVSIIGLPNRGTDTKYNFESANMFTAKDNVVQGSKENDIQKLVDNIQTTNNLITQLFGKEINGGKEDKNKKAAVTVSTTPKPATTTQGATTLDPEVMKFKDLLTRKVDQMVEEFAKRKQAGK